MRKRKSLFILCCAVVAVASAAAWTCGEKSSGTCQDQTGGGLAKAEKNSSPPATLPACCIPAVKPTPAQVSASEKQLPACCAPKDQPVATVQVIAPADGAVMSGTVTLRAELNVPKEVGAAVLHFFVGEADLGPVCPGHPEKEWNTAGWTDKSYQVIARVYRWDREKEARGEELAASPPIQVVVDNSSE